MRLWNKKAWIENRIKILEARIRAAKSMHHKARLGRRLENWIAMLAAYKLTEEE